MNYKETLDFLYNSLPAYQRIGKAAYKADLQTTILLDDHLGNPHKYFKTVHVAGTNGKGSVSHFIASILQEAGYKTALYTSPHIRDFRERIKINGAKIEKEYIIDFVEKNTEIISSIQASFFEMTVAMAFQYFRDKEVDIAIIETGMGGRLDSSNIINPLLSVITNISLDHTQFLGKTVVEIAMEKAGIIKETVPVVIGRSMTETNTVFEAVSKEKGCKLVYADTEVMVRDLKGSNIAEMPVKVWINDRIYNERIEPGLIGKYQIENIATTLSSIRLLESHFEISKTEIERGLRNVVTNTGIEGRWQIIAHDPFIVCDTAHNLDGLTQVIAQLESLVYKNLRFVLGFVDDKEISKILKIFPSDAVYYLTPSSVPRSMKIEILEKEAIKAGLKCRTFDSVENAYNAALEDSDQDDLIFIGGSTFVVADFLEMDQ